MKLCPEYNLAHDSTSANYVAVNWPTPIYWSGVEIANTILVGSGIYAQGAGSLLRRAHEVANLETRQAWDCVAVLYAVLGANGFYADSGNGTVTVNASTGQNSWSASPQSGHYYLVKAKTDPEFVNYVNGWLVRITGIRGVVNRGAATRR